ncbi:hypothetical protein PQX77_002281 [Marasmius sp. AFHP31]|nr:hypothetical protein PQX77_002281 [Marasmius sp. AFHP31]
MKYLVRILLSTLLYNSCAAFNVTIPDQPLINETFKARYHASKDDFDKVPSAEEIRIVLIVPPTTDFKVLEWDRRCSS